MIIIEEQLKEIETKITLKSEEINKRDRELKKFIKEKSEESGLYHLKDLLREKKSYKNVVIEGKKNILNGLKSELIYLIDMKDELLDKLREGKINGHK